LINSLVVVKNSVDESEVVRKETKVVSVKHVPGGVKIVVSAPLFAAAKAELKLPLEYSDASAI
jgi:hypothetical protein